MILRATAGVRSVAFHPDGEQIAAASGDGTVIVLDARTGKVVQTLSGHQESVFSVAFSPGGRHLASASEDRTIRLWDLATGQEVFRRGGQTGEFVGAAYSLAFSPDGRYLVAGSEDRCAIVWDASDGREVRRLPEHESAVTSVAFSPDGRFLATGSKAGALRIWEAGTGRLVRIVRADETHVSAIVFRPTASGWRRQVWIAPRSSGTRPAVRLLQTLNGHGGYISGLALSRDGRRLASSDLEGKTVKIWEPLTGRENPESPRAHRRLHLCGVQPGRHAGRLR